MSLQIALFVHKYIRAYPEKIYAFDYNLMCFFLLTGLETCRFHPAAPARRLQVVLKKRHRVLLELDLRMQGSGLATVVHKDPDS